jgi:hypothetical protein
MQGHVRQHDSGNNCDLLVRTELPTQPTAEGEGLEPPSPCGRRISNPLTYH